MTDRERLLKILNVPIYPHENVDPLEAVADYLLDNGVTFQKWIPVTERLPEERESIFERFYGTNKWIPNMFRMISDNVLAVVKYENGTRKVKELHTTDGEWRFENLYGAKEVTHWMPLPEPPGKE